jgi:hypothetical protein
MSGEDDDATDVASAFTRCESCGTYLVSVSQHRCPSGRADARPDRTERERLATADGRDDATSVGVFPSSQGNRYAYHDLDADGRPRCGCEKHTDATEVTVTSLADAKRRGRSPCGSCRRLRRPERDRRDTG